MCPISYPVSSGCLVSRAGIAALTKKSEDSGYKIGTCQSRSQIVCVALSRGRGNGVADQKDGGLWERYCASVYSSFYLWTVLPCSVCRQIYSLEQCPRGKSRVILEVKEVKQSTKKKKKLKTNSHKRKNRAKKMMLNFRIWNFAISRWNGWMITSDYGTKITWYFVPFFLFFLGHRKTLYWIGENQWNKIFSVPSCCLFVPLQGPQMDKLSPDAIKLAQTLYN